MSHVAEKSLTGRHLRKRFGMLVSRWPWSILFGLYSISVPLGYVWFVPVFTPGTFGIGLALLILNCYSWALLVKPLHAVRPSAFVVRAGKMFCLVGLLVWIASVLLAIEVTVAPNERWTLGDAELRREVYRTRMPRFAGSPVLQVRLKPSLPPLFMMCSPTIGVGHERGGSSKTLYWPTWGLVVSSVLPTLVLVHLRRERIRPSHCRQCDYDLIGNTSGKCPECGSAVPDDIGKEIRETQKPRAT